MFALPSKKGYCTPVKVKVNVHFSNGFIPSLVGDVLDTSICD